MTIEELAILTEITAAIASTETDVRRRALLQNEQWPGDITAYSDVILTCLSDLAWPVREAALMAASRLQSPQIDTRVWTMTLHDPQPLVRDAAARVLGPRINIKRDYHTALSHRHERQRIRAFTAIRNSPQDQAPILSEYVQVGLLDSHVKVRRSAITTACVLPTAVLGRLTQLIERKANECDETIAVLASALLEKLRHDST
jgi:hypothetical protein